MPDQRLTGAGATCAAARRFVVSGAQPPEEFLSIFQEILKSAPPAALAGAAQEATACTRDGACL